MTSDTWPSELRLSKSKDVLHIIFDDGRTFGLRAELLRVESPSAEVQGHGASQKKIVLAKENIKIAGLEPVGNYAVRIVFDDGHDKGLFTWSYLQELGEGEAEIWARYQEAVARMRLTGAS